MLEFLKSAYSHLTPQSVAFFVIFVSALLLAVLDAHSDSSCADENSPPEGDDDEILPPNNDGNDEIAPSNNDERELNRVPETPIVRINDLEKTTTLKLYSKKAALTLGDTDAKERALRRKNIRRTNASKLNKKQRHQSLTKPISPSVLMPILYGTDRETHFDQKKSRIFSADRSGQLLLGEAMVNIPIHHRIGKIERPFHLGVFGYDLLQFPENNLFHFTETRNKLLSEIDFKTNGSLRALVSEKYERTAFVFVHGFNVSFKTAIFTAAQIAFDIGFDGPVYAYSWPSGGTTFDYVYDMDSTRITLPHFSEFLNLISNTKGVDKIHIVAHSMGNVALGNLVSPENPYIEPSAKTEFSQLILAAPDLDLQIFRETSDHFVSFGKGVTLYAARNDIALRISQIIRKGNPRAGDVPTETGPVVVEGIDTIDVSEIDTSFFSLNHSKVATSRNLLNDLGLLLRTGVRPPDHRTPTAVTVTSDEGKYWKLPR
ncbi:alpha/beta hydrolase [Cochlodiniinecator piscidefendens]|uniref:alpha/beta hydrolase n=1 Tax=Cochlodiniinecator piscidefendens TaxID=2715756 RepID=UPI001407E20A|nr:alpha/beta hydrolase [Cochlodiniinecator piscidefendens]